ncbi:MAG: HEAT repeat domain-containing protein [Candidatus Sulfotelmatobacter sp.]
MSQSNAEGNSGGGNSPVAEGYGTLGPGSDLKKSSSASAASASIADDSRCESRVRKARWYQIAAVAAGAGCALLFSGGAGSSAWEKISGMFVVQEEAGAPAKEFSDPEIERQRPQKQAELLLARAVSRNDGASEQIQERAEKWRGKIRWNSQLSDLTTVALNSSDQGVRASAIEVQLAAYGLSKNAGTVNKLVRQADSGDHAQQIWALWALGLLGNRGVETERVVQTLTSHLKERGNLSYRNEEARRWAIEGLALVGTTSTIEPLLEAMHNDPSALVRERAACSLAESGMLNHDQRMAAVPRLIQYSDDPSLDGQTHAWAFQALGDITGQRLGNDSTAWKNWYREQ